ncbi:glutathione S-transferase [Pararhodobacter oceanensis]|uniref:glutathione S-transferase n=1 Tax=Pararhodobacter oceanensis TaxID=2172121 RepID=UPI003A8D7C28
MTDHPILWSFRRCPYAMRARLAVQASGLQVELREILLRDKPEAFLATSPSATVPCLRLPSPAPESVPEPVIDESLDIMIWALKQQDPDGLLDMPEAGWQLIATNDGPFKTALDHTKYAVRYPDLDPDAEREKASAFLYDLDAQLAGQAALFGARWRVADLAILPFVRQFANIDRPWFDAQPWPNLILWLDAFTKSEDFSRVMVKFPQWRPEDAPLWFGG